MRLSKSAGLRVGMLFAEAGCLVVMGIAAWRSGFGQPAFESYLFQPSPDTPEQVYVAWSLAHGGGTLIPVGHELRPSRYSPLHPFMLSLWLRLHGGELSAAFLYAPVTLIAGLLLLWIYLLRLQWPSLLRLLAIWIILASSLSFRISSHTLQEGSLWLLFALALVAAQEANLARRAGAGLLSQWMTGICLGGMIAIRPTLAPVLILFAAYRTGESRRWRMAAGTLIAGAAIPICAALIMGWNHFHRLALTGYHYWIPKLYQGGAFRWGNPWRAPVNQSGLENWQIHARAALGLSADVTTLGPLVTIALIAAGLGASIYICAKGVRRRAMPEAGERAIVVLFLAGASQLIIHAFYEYYAARFYVVAWPAFVIAGIGGWRIMIDAMAARVRRLAENWTNQLGQLLFCLIVLFARPGWWSELTASAQWNADERRGGPGQLAAHRAAARRLRNFDGAVAVYDFHTLNARLLLGLAGSQQPVIPVFAPPRPDWDPHLAPDIAQGLPPAQGKLADWPWPAWEEGLWFSAPGKLNQRQLDALRASGRPFAIYFPAWGEAQMTPVLRGLLAAGWQLMDATERPEGRLFILNYK